MPTMWGGVPEWWDHHVKQPGLFPEPSQRPAEAKAVQPVFIVEFGRTQSSHSARSAEEADLEPGDEKGKHRREEPTLWANA